MQFETTQGIPLDIDFNELLNSRSWELSGNLATHYPCNSDTPLRIIGLPLEPLSTYVINFNILEINGNLKIGLNTPVETFTTVGNHSVEITTTDTYKILTLWGSGKIVIEKLSYLKVDETENPKQEVTITFSEKKDGWIDFRLFRPEIGFGLNDDLYTIKNGHLFVHKATTDNYNVFYGKEYDTYIETSISSPDIKTYQSVAIHANRVFGTTELGIRTSLGHVSDLLEDCFDEENEGIFYANYLRDAVTGYLNGDRLKGRYIVLDFWVKGKKKIQILKIVSKGVTSTPNE